MSFVFIQCHHCKRRFSLYYEKNIGNKYSFVASKHCPFCCSQTLEILRRTEVMLSLKKQPDSLISFDALKQLKGGENSDL